MQQTDMIAATKRVLTTATMAALWLAGVAGGLAADAPVAKPAAKLPPADFHVAVNGKDSNPGTAAAPFATIQRAREAARGKIKEGLAKDLAVEIRGGTYPVAETLTFGPEDSGTEKFSITYAAAPGEKVVLEGGRKITGWKKGTNAIWTAEISDVKEGKWYPRQLFINGQRAIRARTPNQGWCEGRPVQPIKSYPSKPAGANEDGTDQNIVIRMNTQGGKGVKGFYRQHEYDLAVIEGGIAAWGNPGDMELVSLRHNEGGRKAIESIDPVAQTVTLRPPHRWGPNVYKNDWFNSIPDGPCYLENALEFLDTPGEWYLDRKTGVLSYWPRPGEDLPRCEVMAPVVQTRMLYVEGTKERPVVKLHFRGLHVEHVDWPLPPQGYTAMFCCNVPVFREGIPPSHRPMEAAVEMVYARSCSFCDGGIARVGGMGLVLEEGTTDIAVEGNHIQHTGGSGIQLGERNVAYGWPSAAPPPRPGDYERFRVRNNYIHHCGLDYFGGVGLLASRMKNSIISRNVIHDTAYGGVAFPGDMPQCGDFMAGNTFERNEIYHSMMTSVDGGALMTSFRHAGDIVRGNLFHDSNTNFMTAGLCLDGCSGVTFDHNVIYRHPVQSLVLFHDKDLAENSWVGNLVMPTREPGATAHLSAGRFWKINPGKENPAPPDEFIQAMKAYAGLDPAYRKVLQGVDPVRCELHLLEDGDTWQFDFPEQGWGVVYRIVARAGKGAVPPATAGNPVALKLQNLKPASRYTLKTYAGPVRPHFTDSYVNNFLQGPLFPMVHKVGPAPDLGIPESATGTALMEKGLTLKDGMGVVWVAYRQAVMKETAEKK